MYIAAHFAADEQAVDDLLTHHGAADLVTATPEGVVATMLPFVYDPGMRALRGHLARNNDQWRRPVVGEALVIVRGPDAYISPAWYPSRPGTDVWCPLGTTSLRTSMGDSQCTMTRPGSNRMCVI